jgi:uncharacterized protein
VSKIVLLVLAALAFYLLLKGFGRKASAAKRRDTEPRPDTVESMVACAQCGVNLPISEALAENGAYFCGEAHRRLGGR